MAISVFHFMRLRWLRVAILVVGVYLVVKYFIPAETCIYSYNGREQKGTVHGNYHGLPELDGFDFSDYIDTYGVKVSDNYDKLTFGQELRNCTGQDPVADPRYSKLRLLSHDTNPGGIVVLATMYDNRGTLINKGGDIVVIWAEEKDGNQSVAGHVIDNQDGTHTGFFITIWSGKTVIRAKIVSVKEDQCLRSNALIRYGETNLARKSGFVHYAQYAIKGASVHGVCVGHEVVGPESSGMCNYTELNGGIPWYCQKPPPQYFNCTDIKRIFSGILNTDVVPESEKYSRVHHGTLNESVTTMVERTAVLSPPRIKCWEKPCQFSWSDRSVSGYWSRDRWISITCNNSMMPRDVQFYRNCLRGKHVTLIGDSTVNQYTNYFLDHVLDMPNEKGLKDNFYNNNLTYHSNKTFHNYGITLVYKRHAYPFYGTEVRPVNVTSVAYFIKELTESDVTGERLVLLIHVNLHLHAYHIRGFQFRIRTIVSALKDLLRKKPQSTVIIKGPHLVVDTTRWFDNRVALIFKDILFEEFSGLQDQVFYMNAWDISVANDEHKMHPDGNSFTSQIQMIISHACKY